MEIDAETHRRIAHTLSKHGVQGYAVHATTTRGQNNDIVTIQIAPNGAEIIFRFPRHPRASDELAREVELLRALRGRLPLPIPDPVFSSLDVLEPGKAFLGYSKLSGAPLSREVLDALPSMDDRQRVAELLGAFLTTLHAVPPEDFDLPLHVVNDRATWERMYADVRARLFAEMRPDARQRVAAHFEAYLDDVASSSWKPALIHGDFGSSNILYDAAARNVSGILDWGSAGLGDPATDLAALICPASYGEGFADLLTSAYPALVAELTRARFYAGTFALQEALFGLEAGDAEAFEAGIANYR